MASSTANINESDAGIRLCEIARDGLLRRITPLFRPGSVLLVTGEAGAGKSVFVRQLMERCAYNFSVLDMRGLGPDEATLVRVLISVWARLWPDVIRESVFEKKVCATASPWVVMEQMLDEMVIKGSAPAVMVVEGCEVLKDRPGWSDIVTMILERFPSFASMVLVSRDRLDLAPIPALRLEGRIVEVESSDLHFDEDEAMEYLLTNVPALEKGAARRIYEKVAGWPAGLSLVCMNMKKRPAGTDSGRFSSKEIFSYLQHEIFSGLDQELRRVLCVAACIQPFDMVLLGRFLPAMELDGAGLFLEHSTFVERDDGGEGKRLFRFSSLFSDFLREKAIHILGQGEYDRIHRDAALFFEKRGEIDRALHHFGALRSWNQVTRLVLSIYEDWIEKGRFEELSSWIEMMPQPVLEKHPVLFTVWGLVNLYLGNLEDAQDCFSLALKYLGPREKQRFKAGSKLCEILLLAGEPEKAEELARRLVSESGFFSRYKAEAMLFHAIALHQMCRFRECGRRWRQVEAIATSRILPIDQAARCYLITPKAVFYNLERGEFEESEHILDHSIAVFRKKDPEKRLSWALLFKGVLKLEQLQFDKALSWFREAENVSSSQNRSVHAVATAFMAFVFAQSGRLDEAGRWLKRAEQMAGRDLTLWVEVLNAITMAFLCHTASDKGSALRKAWNLSIRRRMIMLQSFVAYTAFQMRRILADVSLVKDYLRKVVATSRRWEVSHREARARLYLLWLRLEAGDDCEAQPLSGAMELIAEKGLGFLLVEDSTIDGLRIAETAMKAGFQQDFLLDLWAAWGDHGSRKLLGMFSDSPDSLKLGICNVWLKTGFRAAASLVSQQAKRIENPQTSKRLQKMARLLSDLPPERLHIRLLGSFQVRRGETLIDERAWKRQKARELFKFLSLNAGVTFTQDQLMELFWPDSVASKAKSNLWSTISAVRTALEPFLSPKARSSYIVVRNKTYTLYLPEGSTLDIRLFEQSAEEGFKYVKSGDMARAFLCFQKASDIYREGLLVEDLYADWCAEERERFRLLLARVLRGMGTIYLERRDYEGALRVNERLIGLDSWDEEAYFHLMKCYVLLGQEAKALDVFKKCQAVLKTELDIEPDERLWALYRRITKRRAAL